MSPTLYAHPFSSYCQKALIAFYENAIPFTFRQLGEPEIDVELERLWPLKRFPVLVDDGHVFFEATIIVEYLDAVHAGQTRFIPANASAATDVRMLDRFFDNYIMTPMQKIVGDALRPAESRDSYGVGEARVMLDKAYAWLDARMATRDWAAGDFSLADCAAAPSLFYADWAHPIGEPFVHVRSYRARLLARPSIVRAVDEARPYRKYFPLGAPDRD